MSRKRTREKAYQLLFSYAFRRESNDYGYDEVLLNEEMDEEDKAYLSEVFHNIPLRYDELTADISPLLKNFTLDRLAVTDLTALLLSAYELKYMPSIPAKVSVNEAVNLAKKFSTDQSGAFVNGVLAALVKKYRGDEVK